MDLSTSKMLHPSNQGSHTVTLRAEGVMFVGDCTCGMSSGPCTTAGMVWGWEASHREDMREQAIAHREANDRAWDLFESMHGVS